MATAIVKGALLAGKLGTKKALKLLKDHGHKAKGSRKGDKRTIYNKVIRWIRCIICRLFDVKECQCGKDK